MEKEQTPRPRLVLHFVFTAPVSACGLQSDSAEMPVPSGPRHRVQSEADAGIPARQASAIQAIRVISTEEETVVILNNQRRPSYSLRGKPQFAGGRCCYS